MASVHGYLSSFKFFLDLDGESWRALKRKHGGGESCSFSVVRLVKREGNDQGYVAITTWMPLNLRSRTFFFFFFCSMSSHLMLAEAIFLYLGIQRATWLSPKVELKAPAGTHMPSVGIPQRPAVCWRPSEGITQGRKRVPSTWVWVYGGIFHWDHY